MAGFLLDSAAQTAEIKLGGYSFTVKHEYTWPYAAHAEGATPRVGGMIIMVSPEEFYVAGSGVVVTFAPAAEAEAVAGILSMDEGMFVKGKWTAGRRLFGQALLGPIVCSPLALWVMLIPFRADAQTVVVTGKGDL
jgi:hypothetical protein